VLVCKGKTRPLPRPKERNGRTPEVSMPGLIRSQTRRKP
jgi:hypothetical protein